MLAVGLPSTATLASSAMMAAPDPTPLLWDRVRAFDAVVVASTGEGFEKNSPAMAGSNTVLMPVKIEKVIKGDLKEGDFNVNCHQMLPKLLAARDKDAKHRYLLVVKVSKGTGVLMSANLYGDLARFLPADGAMEKVATAFIKAADDKRATIIPLCNELLADKAMTAPAARHVCELLTRVIAEAEALQVAIIEKDLSKPAALLIEWGKKGAIESVSGPIVAIADSSDNPADVKVLDPSLAEPARAWLTERVEKDADPARPDYMMTDQMAAVLSLEGKLKDKSAKDVLLKIIGNERWKGSRAKAIATVNEIFGDDAKAILAPVLKNLPADPPRLIID